MSKELSMSAAVAARLAKAAPIFVAGQWLGAEGRECSDVFNPSSGECIGQAVKASSDDVDAAVAAARKAFDEELWTGLRPADRAKVLWRVADLLEANAAELAELDSLNAGKFLAATEFGEVPFAAECFRYYAGWCTKLEGSSKQISSGPDNDFHTYTTREPVGVAALIVPWNGPLVQAAWKLAPALAAGCSCIIKPAEETPLSTVLLLELMLEAGVPAGVVNLILGDGAVVGHQLSAHEGVDKVSFTGSTAVGKKIVAAAMGNLKKVSLELGGKSPMIVFPDADLDAAAQGVIDGIFSNAGQVCVASSRIFIHSDIYEALLAKIKTKAESIKSGPVDEADSSMGPLISERQYHSVQGHIQKGIDEGARLLCGGKAVAGQSGYFVEPTVFADVKADMSIAQEEIFGPVLSALVFDSSDDIEAMANDSDYGLAASIWTRDISLAHKTAKKIKAGLLWVNCHGIPDMAVPFGGYKQSGWGRENGFEALLQYTEMKSVIVRL